MSDAPVREGENFIWMKATALQGNEEIKIIHQNVDSTQPNITILAPENNDVINENTTIISAMITDQVTGVNPESITIDITGPCGIQDLKTADYLSEF